MRGAGRRWSVRVLVGLGIVLTATVATGENVKEAWRSAYGTPYAVSVNWNDNSLWAATGNSVVHVTLNGTVQKQVDGFYTPRAIAVDQSDGTVWVADTGHNQVVKLGGDGTEQLRLDGYSGPSSLAVDPDASTAIVWVADTVNNQVVKLNASTGAELWRSAVGAFSSPRSVSANTYWHTCWVADTGHNEVVQLDTDGSEIGRYDDFSAPSSVAVQAENWYPLIWVADAGNNRLRQLDDTGAVTATVTGFLSPQAVSVDATTGLCWALDTGNHQVVHLDVDGSVLFRGGNFDTPASVATNKNDGSCWIGDTVRAQVTHLASAGTVLATKALLTVAPIAIAGAPDGTSWVGVQSDWDSEAAKYHGSVMHIGLDGATISQAEICQVPASIALAPDGTVWVADSYGSKVYQLVESGSDLTIQWQSGAGAFAQPGRLQVDQETGDVWIPDYGHDQIVRLDPTGVQLKRVSGYDGVSELAIDPLDNTVWTVIYSLDAVVHVDLNANPIDTYLGFTGPFGIAVDAVHDKLWVGEYNNLFYLNKDGTEVWHKTGNDYSGGEEMVTNPTDGTVAYLSWSTAAVVSPSGATVFNSNEYGGASIGICPDGTFWIGNNSTNVLRRVAPDGMVVKQLSGFRQPSSISALDSDQSVWVADTGNSRAVHLESDGGQIGENVTDLTEPVAVSAYTDGSAWIADKSAGKLFRLAGDATVTTSASGLASPVSVSVDATNNMTWVGVNGQVGKYNSAAVQQLLAGTFSNKPLVAAYPVDGSVWVADTNGNQVVHLSSSGSPIGSPITGFTGLGAIAANTVDGDVWVADSTKVYHYSSSGAAIGSAVTGFHAPAGLAVNSDDGSVWVVDTGGGAVVHLDADGTELWRGTEFVSPASVSAIASDGTVWVTDTGLNQVVKLVPAPAAEFSADPVRGVAPLDVTFSDESTGNPTTWSWTFGDGGTSTAQNPTHTYASVNAYTVSLTVSNGLYDDTKTKTNYINVGTANPPTADFSATPLTGAAPLAVQFTDLTTNIPSGWSWAFGDGGTSTDQNPSHTYTANGTYSVSLTASNEYGNNTKTKDGYIVVGSGASAADFTVDPALAIAPSIVEFTDTSTNSPTAWLWDFGDPASGASNSSAAQDPTHTFAKPGQYDVTLTATGSGGPQTTTKEHVVLVSFPDVPVVPVHWALHQILACVDAAIVQGYPGGNYGPADPVSRGQMAVYMARALAGGDAAVPAPGVAVPTFADVGTGHWAYRYVEYCFAQGIVVGYPDGYRPDEQVNRGQMAVYVARAVAGGNANVPDYTGAPDFTDVTETGSWAWCYKYVEYCFGAGIVQGYADGYHPERTVTRDQMAVYVARAFDLPM